MKLGKRIALSVINDILDEKGRVLPCVCGALSEESRKENAERMRFAEKGVTGIMGKQAFYDRIRTVFGVDEPKKIAAYCKENWKEDVEHVMRTAKDVCSNTFLFDFRWDMERTYEPIHFENEIDWSLIPFGDREFLWQFNRHRFQLCLSQAYQMTGDETYAENSVRLMRDWIRRAEPGDNINLGPWRTLETGIRAENWLRTLALLEDSPAVDDAFIEEVEACVKKHAKRLYDNFQPHKYISNWGVLESSGLLLFSLAMEDGEEKETCQKMAMKRLFQCADVQVLHDGTQWEQSPMYHNEVYHCFLNAYYYGTRAGIDMEGIREVVRKMARVNYAWKKPDHTQFTQGDSDASDLRDQITAGAYVVSDASLKSGGYPILDYESAWQFGWKACETYREMKADHPGFESVELPFSGNYYMRSGWNETDHLLHFYCGETGGGHGHADKLHVDLVINGEDILVDSGRATYVDSPIRYDLKEPAAHNVVLMDGKPFSVCEESWTYKNLCTCLKQQYFEGKTGAFAEGSHMGYMEEGVLANRKVIWIKPDIFVIVDDFYGKGAHSYETYFHFGRQGKAALTDTGVRFEGEKTTAWLTRVDVPAKREIRETVISSHYNEHGTNQTYWEKAEAEGTFSRITVIHGGPKETAKPVSVERIGLHLAGYKDELEAVRAEGLRILAGEKEYILFLCHEEVMTPTDILYWENCVGYGKAVLFDRTEEKKETITGEILAW